MDRFTEIALGQKRNDGQCFKFDSTTLKAKLIRTTYCFFITIFRLATPAFFRFTDVTELKIGITILYRWRMSQ